MMFALSCNFNAAAAMEPWLISRRFLSNRKPVVPATYPYDSMAPTVDASPSVNLDLTIMSLIRPLPAVILSATRDTIFAEPMDASVILTPDSRPGVDVAWLDAGERFPPRSTAITLTYHVTSVVEIGR